MSEQPAGDRKRLDRFRSSRGDSSDRRPRGDDLGFTLIELLVVLVIMPLVIGAISIGLISVMKQQNNVSNKVSDSQDTQVVSAIFVQDVQSASQITFVKSPVPCGTQTPIFSLLLQPPSPAAPSQAAPAPAAVVSYDVFKPNGASNYELLRYACLNGTSASPMKIVAYDVQSSLTPTITGKSCSLVSLNCSAWPPQAVTSGWVSTAGIAGIALNINPQSAGDQTYNYSLTGVPRVSNSSSRGPNGPSGEPPGHPTALTLGAQSVGVNCSGSGNAGLTINGTLQINSTSSTVASTNHNASISASSIDTGSTSTTSLSGNVNPATPSQTGVTVQDPYAGFTPPVTGLQQANPTPGSTYQGYNVYGGGAYAGQSGGIFTNTLTFPNGTTTLKSGVYILMNGIKLSGQQNLDGTAGVFLYVLGGSVDLTGQGQVTLAPLAAGSAPYPNAPSPWPGIVIWQDATDSAFLALAGNGVGNVINGTVYAPSASAGTNGNGGLTTGSIIAAGIGCNGNGAFNIG
jgi:prepilin-type N-terminal cleavage/methylation domain-containing protein